MLKKSQPPMPNKTAIDNLYRWPICPNCAAGLSETDYEVGFCTQCGFRLGPTATKETRTMSTIATNDENVSFRIQDQNRSTFWVESRPKDYRVGVEVLGQGVNYFYFTPEQYKIFIHSEFNRLFKVSKRQLSAKEMHNGNSEQVDNTSERTGNRLSDNTPGTEATTTRTKT